MIELKGVGFGKSELTPRGIYKGSSLNLAGTGGVLWGQCERGDYPGTLPRLVKIQNLETSLHTYTVPLEQRGGQARH